MRAVPGDVLPPELAMGPQIEFWAADYKPRPYADYMPLPMRLAFHALRTWQAAVDEWAESTGWTETRSTFEARRLARTQRPWSRDYLIANGRREWADYYEHGGEHPGRIGEM